MAYDYYCVDCGSRMSGGEIRFDLADILKLDGADHSLTRVSYEELVELCMTKEVPDGGLTGNSAWNSNHAESKDSLYEENWHRVEIRLDRFLKQLAKNSVRKLKGGFLKEQAFQLEVDRLSNQVLDFSFEELEGALKKLSPAGSVNEKQHSRMANMAASIKKNFHFQKDYRTAKEELEAARETFEWEDKQVRIEEAKKEEAEEKREESKRNNGKDYERIDEEIRIQDQVVKAARDRRKLAEMTLKNVQSNDFANYSIFLWMKPVFLKGEEPGNPQIYSLLYTLEEDFSGFSDDQEEMYQFRGYCPRCGAPVLKGTGKYPHRLVGVIGDRQAGKTSLITSMMNCWDQQDTQCIQDQLGEILPDSGYYAQQWNRKLYRGGWEVESIQRPEGKGLSSVSVLINSFDSKNTVLTLIEISSDNCWNTKSWVWKSDTMRKYPLLRQCDVVLLCFGMHLDEQMDGVSPNADMICEMTKGLYRNIRAKEEYGRTGLIPPLGIIVTKEDMLRQETSSQDMVDEKDTKDTKNTQKNPFDQFLDYRNAELYVSGLKELEEYYRKALTGAQVCEMLDGCSEILEEMSAVTYVSILPCSAFDGIRVRYKGALEKMSKAKYEEQLVQESCRENLLDNSLLSSMSVPLYDEAADMADTSQGIRELWNWLLCVLGLQAVSLPKDEVNGDILPEKEDYLLPDIPSYNDSYITKKERKNQKESNPKNTSYRKVFKSEQAADRIRAVEQLFLNCSEMDEVLLTEYIDVEEGKLWRKKSAEKRRRKAIEKKIREEEMKLM